MERASLSSLPGEILLNIISYLDAQQITKLQLVSRAFRDVARDNSFWRLRCLYKSYFLDALNRRTLLSSPDVNGISNPFRQSFAGSSEGAGAGGQTPAPGRDGTSLRWPDRERVRILANWDLSYTSDRVSWYDEYIQRHAPIATNWVQQPLGKEGTIGDVIDARGLAVYRPDGDLGSSDGLETLLAVAPLDDGGVCLWDINGTKIRRGGILARSKPGILFPDGPNVDTRQRSKRIDSGVTECVSIDHHKHLAFFAVQSRLIEVDLHTLEVTGSEPFPWSITALSETTAGLPLTVGTTLGIHMHDHRLRAKHRGELSDRINDFDRFGADGALSLRFLFDDQPATPFASLSQPGPLSILHLPQPGNESLASQDIYVAGRFSNILHYDRRKFPSIMGSIHSGARLCSLASLPHPFSPLNSELRRKGLLSLEQVERSKMDTGGSTLMACGEYNTKGSLEMYGLSRPSAANPSVPGGLQDSAFKNRQTSSPSKLLSVVNHGTRIAFSDGSGCVNWFERDGFTEVRRWRIGHSERPQATSLFASMPGSDDMARKLIPTRAGPGSEGVNANDLLFWTGDKLGLVSFQSKPGSSAEDYEDRTVSAEAAEQDREERAYAEKMRQALERQADDVRFVRNLGLGSGIPS